MHAIMKWVMSHVDESCHFWISHEPPIKQCMPSWNGTTTEPRTCFLHILNKFGKKCQNTNSENKINMYMLCMAHVTTALSYACGYDEKWVMSHVDESLYGTRRQVCHKTFDVCVCVCMCVCMRVRVCVCMCVCIYVCLYVSTGVCMYVCLSGCM